MNKLYVLIGLPGSGKSTIASKMAKRFNAKIVSSDSIRKDLFGDESVQDNYKLVFKIVDERIDTYLSAYNVIYDATNYSRKVQRDLVEKWGSKATIIAYYLDIPLEECLIRNKSRERVVPEEVIEKMNNKLYRPTTGDGWDKVVIING